MTKGVCYITLREGQWAVIEFPYSLKMVQALKKIPYYLRRYIDEPENRRWEFDQKYLPQIQDVAKECFDRCYLIEGAITTNLNTGFSMKQGALFGE